MDISIASALFSNCIHALHGVLCFSVCLECLHVEMLKSQNRTSQIEMFKTLKKISKVGTFSSTSSSSCSSGTTNSSNGDESASNVIGNDEPTKLSDHVSSYQSRKAKFNVIAMHNYNPVNEETDLALRKGEILEILDSSGVWWMARDRRGQIGLVPYNYTQTIANETALCLSVCGDHGRKLIRNGRHAKRQDYGKDLIKRILDNDGEEEEEEEEEEDGDDDDDDDDCEEQVQERLMHCIDFNQDECYDAELEPESTLFRSAASKPNSICSALLPPPLPPHQHRHSMSKASTAVDSTVMMDLNVLSLWQHAWFFAIDRRTSEQLLQQQCHRDGCFLVRPSTTENDCFTLSVLIKKKQRASYQVKHYLIQKCQSAQNAMYYIRPQEKFPSIEILIEHHRKNRGHLPTQLSQVPCRANFIWQKHSSLQAWQPGEHIAPCMDGLMMMDGSRASNMSQQQQQQSMVAKRLVDLTKDKYWEIKVSELQLLEELGSGQFGVVRHGKWKSKFDVAVKLMKEGTMSEQDFIDEAKVMTKLQHPNLVKLYGICIEHRPICIVAEFMKHGSLLCFLRKNEAKILDSSQKVRFLLNMCIQVASAMAYLESHNYIHRDLAARNCLVGNSNVVKVADFGLTRYVIDDEYTSSGGTKFPIRWAPPEVLWFTRFSSKSDVWAYGILVWEVFSLGKLPYGKLTNAEVVEKIRQGHRLDKPKHCPPEIFQVIKSCWQEVAEKRPSFQKIERCLITLKECDMDQSSSNGGNITGISTSPTKQHRQF